MMTVAGGAVIIGDDPQQRKNGGCRKNIINSCNDERNAKVLEDLDFGNLWIDCARKAHSGDF